MSLRGERKKEIANNAAEPALGVGRRFLFGYGEIVGSVERSEAHQNSSHKSRCGGLTFVRPTLPPDQALSAIRVERTKSSFSETPRPGPSGTWM